MKPPRLRSQIVLFTVTRMVLNMGTRMVYPFLSTFQRGLGVSFGDISAALTIRSLIGAFSPLLTMFADRKGRKPSMLAGLGMFVAGAFLVIAFPSFFTFATALSLGFLGMFLYMSSMQAYLGDSIAFKKRGTALSVTEMGWSFSFIIGMPVLGFLMDRYGWMASFPLLAGLGLVTFLLIAIYIPNSYSKNHINLSQKSSIVTVLKSRSARAGLAVSFLLVMANESINVVFGVWMEDSFQLKLAALGLASALIGFAELGGESLGAGVIDRLGKKRSIYAGMAILLITILFLPLLGKSLAGALVGLFFFYLIFEFTFVGTLPMMTEILPDARATLLGVNVAAFSLGRMAGDLISPVIYQWGFRANTILSAVLILLAAFALREMKIYQPDIPIRST